MRTVYRFSFLLIFFLSSMAFSQQNLLYDQVQLAKKSGKAEFITVPQFFKETSVDRGVYGRFENQDQVYFLDFDGSLVGYLGESVSLTIPLRAHHVELELLAVLEFFLLPYNCWTLPPFIKTFF